ncbi:MAG TPA: AarF/UbiB family protein [Myxococcales bacterium]|jgi:ubiquinone biosynthesis protein|nr:AarF/UbiB family protein [Myxococcales bacterium]
MIQAVKDLQRLREITSVVARHGFGELLDRSRIWEALGRREKAERLDPAAQRASTARRFRDTLAELGPTFIKLGQILSSRPDILPPDFIAELSTLQDRAAPMPLELVLSLIDEGLCGLGPNARTQFERIDPEPLASASIAQVHCARLKPAPGQVEGERVVVKVQRPGIEQQIRSDTDLLFYLARFLEGVIEETGIYTPTGIVTEFRNAMLTELDFENEARNIAEFARNHQARPYVAIPSLHTNLSSRTVLTMGELVGVKMSDVLREPSRWDCKLLARQILDASFHQLFTDGLFHGDPHPGNVLVLEGNRLGLLDFGLVGRMHKGMQESIILLVLAISLKDPDTVARLLYKAGIPDQRIDLHRFRADIGDLLDNYLGIKLSEIDSGTLLTDLVDLALKYKIKIPKEYAVLSKAAATTEGLLRVLDPDLDVVEAALPYAKQLLFERYNPTSMSGGLLRLLLQLQGFLQDTPQQLSQILMDLEGGKFSVHVRNEELQKVNGSLKALGIVVFMSTMASALIVGAFTLVGRSPPEQGGGTTWPLPALVGLALAAMLFGAVLTWTFLSGRLRKLSVRRWMK